MKRQQTEINIGNMLCRLMMDDRATESSHSFSHIHTSYELFYVWQGEITISTEDKIYTVRQGQAALIAPSFYHRTQTKEGTKKFNLLFSFARNGRRKCTDVYSEFLRVFSGKPLRVLSSDALDISSLRDIRAKDCFCRDERLHAELVRLLFMLYDILKDKAKKMTNAGGDTAIGMQYRYEIDRLLAKSYATDADLEFLADALHLSKKRVSVLIKSLYGKNFRQLKCEMRIQVAKQLLKESDMTVAAVATAVGYKSTRGFLMAFESTTDTTPTEYRRRK